MADFDEVARFHGHKCPGLALGFRVALAVQEEMGAERPTDEELIAVVENNSCAVDAIQYMLGCTFGKGNLFFRDHGKQVYTFQRRPSDEALRVSVIWEYQGTPEEQEAWRRHQEGEKGLEVTDMVAAMRSHRMAAILATPSRELFALRWVVMTQPESATIHSSLPCDACGEKVMAPKLIRRGSRALCLPCAQAAGELTIGQTEGTRPQ